MGYAMPWIMISIGILLVLLGVVAVIVKRKTKRPVDYRAFFIMGVVWLPLGVIFDNYAFTVMGIVFMVLGLAHKKEWKKNHKPWSKMSKQEKRLKLWIIISLLIVFLAGLAAYILLEKGII